METCWNNSSVAEKWKNENCWDTGGLWKHVGILNVSGTPLLRKQPNPTHNTLLPRYRCAGGPRPWEPFGARASGRGGWVGGRGSAARGRGAHVPGAGAGSTCARGTSSGRAPVACSRGERPAPSRRICSEWGGGDRGDRGPWPGTARTTGAGERGGGCVRRSGRGRAGVSRAAAPDQRTTSVRSRIFAHILHQRQLIV